MKKKVLIIGSSKSIKNLSLLIFNKNEELFFLNFRKVWKLKKIKKYDTIVLSGFHYKICDITLTKLKNYTKNYYIFLMYLRKRCTRLILITTFLNIEYSFCRVVYFYYMLLKEHNLLGKNGIEIYNFKKIILFNLFPFKYLKKIFLSFNFEDINNISNNFFKYRIKKIDSIKFYFINLTRNRLIDRILRIL